MQVLCISCAGCGHRIEAKSGTKSKTTCRLVQAKMHSRVRWCLATMMPEPHCLWELYPRLPYVCFSENSRARERRNRGPEFTVTGVKKIKVVRSQLNTTDTLAVPMLGANYTRYTILTFTKLYPPETAFHMTETFKEQRVRKLRPPIASPAVVKYEHVNAKEVQFCVE